MKERIRVRHWWILGGFFISAFLFWLFFTEQMRNDVSYLELEAQWLALACLPALMGLFKGGLISSFKGFGIEIESQLDKPVQNIEKLDTLSLVEEGDVDQAVQLKGVQPAHSDAKVLCFRYKTKPYYRSGAIAQQLDMMPNKKYLRIDSTSGKFLCLLPVTLFIDGGNAYVLDELIKSLDERNTHSKFKEDSLRPHISTSTSKLDAIRYLHARKLEEAPVVDTSGKFIGLIQTKDLALQLADAIITADKVA